MAASSSRAEACGAGEPTGRSITDTSTDWILLSLAPARRERVRSWFAGIDGLTVTSVVNGLDPLVLRRSAPGR
jgi:hypothetical protein